jgi:hypothetical protein
MANYLVNEELVKFENGVFDDENSILLDKDSLSPLSEEVAAIIAAAAATTDIELGGFFEKLL